MIWGRRISWAIAGILWFLWLGYEDQSLGPVLILGASISLAIGMEGIYRVRIAARLAIPAIRASLVGLLLGALVPVNAIILVLVKTSLHQHDLPDFSLNDIVLLLGRAPYWAIAGLLFGAAYGVWDQRKTVYNGLNK